MVDNKLVKEYIHFSYQKTVTDVEVFALEGELFVDFDICNGKGTVRVCLKDLPNKKNAINKQISDFLFEKPSW